ncbi:dethiobiotin synthase [Psychromonas sp. 14N.309.X.WAT.B.A12]|uniref:dethiobiotin synthase n=1 Tax=unclassified Psychromonas TaxID=2614957 RepID=UPI0025AFF111|nr:dethiobiotin synthase [Psychromonas sp. 14N.309.X.WAT.B.A12]MDN2662150.1 dethiobiotin synthase [Psychromonas sp. 14N.309.X.WAT.B.A12]
MKLVNKVLLNRSTYFVTGTDTDVGKTVCTRALLQAANKQNKTTIGYKPISAGCELTDSGLRNQDALILQANSSVNLAYQDVNPIAFKQPIAPHIAAIENESFIDIDIIDNGLQHLQSMNSDLVFVEGAGGWHLPINNQRLLSDWVIQKQLPVILVVGLKLGCLNHALLTAKAIEQSGLVIAGWIANHLQPEMPYVVDNIETLKTMVNAPLLAEIKYMNDIESMDLAEFVDVTFI